MVHNKQSFQIIIRQNIHHLQSCKSSSREIKNEIHKYVSKFILKYDKTELWLIYVVIPGSPFTTLIKVRFVWTCGGLTVTATATRSWLLTIWLFNFFFFSFSKCQNRGYTDHFLVFSLFLNIWVSVFYFFSFSFHEELRKIKNLVSKWLQV